MKRREFMAAACAAGTMGMTTAHGKSISDKKLYLELRRYEFESAVKQKQYDDFLSQAAIPALNKIGVKPVGVFGMAADESADLYVLMPHKTMESLVLANSLLLQDSGYLQQGKAVLECPKKKPVYKRFESSLLLGFDACPGVEIPTTANSRLFQLRIYESHNTPKAKRKVEMFNKGEVDLFRRTGLNPVFFGEAIIGTRLPNLTYMVGFEDESKKKAAWDMFKKHPEWKKMSSDPYYKDTVSHIANLVLRPTAASQI